MEYNLYCLIIISISCTKTLDNYHFEMDIICYLCPAMSSSYYVQFQFLTCSIKGTFNGKGMHRFPLEKFITITGASVTNSLCIVCFREVSLREGTDELDINILY